MGPVFRGRRTTRLETFVDAAFAFALTMLVVSVDTVPQSFEELVLAIKRVPAFAASFLITVMFWLGHYRWSRRYGIEDTGSVVLSLTLVFLVLVFLYPLRLMMSGALEAMSGGYLPGEIEITRIAHLQFLFVLYGVAFMLMSGVLLLLYARVLRMPLEPALSAEDRAVAGVEVQAWGILAAMAAASVLLALVLPPKQIVYAVWIYASLAIVMPLMGRVWQRRVERAVAAQPPQDGDPGPVSSRST
jgi:uncharacterized membrane protein